MSIELERAVSEFCQKVRASTGKNARESDVKGFVARVETEAAHDGYRTPGVVIQCGIMMERTLSGRAEVIEVKVDLNKI